MIVITQAHGPAKRAVSVADVPTPEEIREMTAEIRKSWSPYERRRRANYILRYVELPQLALKPSRKGFCVE